MPVPSEAARHPPQDAAAPGALAAEWVHTPGPLLALRRDWEALSARDPETGVFLSWPWLAEAFLRNPGRWQVLALRERDGALVALLPLKRVRTAGQAGLSYEAGGGLALSEYTGFVCDPALEAQAMAELARHLAAAPWRSLSLRYVEPLPRAERFAAAFPARSFAVEWAPLTINGGTTDNLRCPRIALPATFEAWVEGLGANMRQRLRRMRRRWLDSGAARVTLVSRASFARDAAILTGLWERQWAPRKGVGRAAAFAARYRAMLAQALDIGALHLPVLWLGERPVAALGGIADRRRGILHFVLAGRDPEAEAVPTGLLLHAEGIAWAIAAGFRTYDLGHGDEPYKYTFGATDSRVGHLRIARRGPDGGRPAIAREGLVRGPDRR